MASAPLRSFAVWCTTAIALAVLLCAVSPARADKKSDAREQFARAVKMRTMLEGYLEKDRSRSDYIQTIAAYHKVYMITPLADDATSSLMAEAELYREMGRLYDPQYLSPRSLHIFFWQSSIRAAGITEKSCCLSRKSKKTIWISPMMPKQRTKNI